MLEHVVATLKKTLPEEHPRRLPSEQWLATAYLFVSRIKEAIEILERCVTAMRKKNIAPEDHCRLTAEYALACTYFKDGRTREAIEIFEYVVAVE